ncbi:MAG: polysaccharide biosynthesis protein [Candidatus Nanopelagicales bacterium]
MFEPALRQLQRELAATYEGARVLVTGGAGFIAGQTLRTILPFRPRTVVVADHDENSLAELVRDLRTSGSISTGTRLVPRLVDVTGPLIDRVVAEDGPFDVVLAFAACKHVRSERDAVSALHMLNVNVNGTIRPVRAAKQHNPDCRVFVVSTDKAADPASMMGASKRVMEMLVLGQYPEATTARFANVAFSSGSLLESWLIRLANDQVLPVPADTNRYFVTPAESGHLCTLASVAPPGSIVIPDPQAVGIWELQLALERVLASLHLTAEYITEDLVGAAQPTADTYPVLVTERDTPGEKAAEVFIGADEVAQEWVSPLFSVHSPHDVAAAEAFAGWVAEAVGRSRGPDLGEIEAALAGALHRFAHISGTSGLDDRV